MRLTPHTLARGCLTLATATLAAAVVTVLPGGAATAAAKPAPPAAKASPPPAVGGFLADPVRSPVRKPRGGVRANEVLPASVDLRQYAPSPGNQGQVGSCVAWTIAYGMMGYYANRTGGVGAPYAPLFLYLRNVAPGGAPTAGLYPDSVLANAQAAGVDTQSHYWQGTTDYKLAPTAEQVANAVNYRVNGYTRLFNGANQGEPVKTAFKQALASGNPVGLAIPVYQDFHYLRTHTLYNTLSGTSAGGHMITAFGYDDQGVWIRNSWGTNWGNTGDAKLSWTFITKIAMAAWTINGIKTPATPVAMPPTVGSLSVSKAAAGTAVTIIGSGLAEATSVRFGDTPATFKHSVVNGSTRLVATAPPRANGPVDVTVTNPSGTSAVVPAGTFTYIAPAPVLSGLSPSSVSIGGGTTVTVTGTNLLGATVRVGTTVVPAKAVTATSLTFAAPARAAGTVGVTVTTPSGTSAAGPLSYFVPPAPVVTSITPSGAFVNASTAVLISGTQFGAASKVLMDGVAVPFARVSETTLKATLPPHAAGAVTLTVTTPGGTSAGGKASTFTYAPLPVPAVTSLTPSSALTYVSTPVVVNGINLAGVTKVTVGGLAVPFTKISNTSLKATLPARAAGVANLQVIAAGGTSAGTAFTRIAPPVPAVAAVSPLAKAGTVVTTPGGLSPSAAYTSVTTVAKAATAPVRFALL